jgi:hypothetical protein
LPRVFKVAENVPVPFVSVALAGNAATPSLLVKCTVPAYPVAVAFDASSAVTVKSNAVPAVAFVGAVTEKCVAGPASAGAPMQCTVPEAISLIVITEPIAFEPWLMAIAASLPVAPNCSSVQAAA